MLNDVPGWVITASLSGALGIGNFLDVLLTIRDPERRSWLMMRRRSKTLIGTFWLSRASDAMLKGQDMDWVEIPLLVVGVGCLFIAGLLAFFDWRSNRRDGHIELR